MTTRAQAEENYPGWTPKDRAEVAEDFMERLKKEFAGRLDRLQKFMGKAPVLDMKFLDSNTSSDPKVAAEWKRFREGGMGEGGTTKWVTKIVKELESARRALAMAEKPASTAWEKKYKDNPPPAVIPPAQQAMIYEMDVQASQLGVILDSSVSMTKYLPTLRQEISKRFANTRFTEIEGCYLETPNKHWGLHGEWYYTTPPENENLFDPKWWLPEIPKDDLHFHINQWLHDTLGAMTAMVNNMGVDALYWFCDFDDKIEPAAIKALEKLLEPRKVRLYVHTVKSSPPTALANLIKHTGGNLTKASPDSAKNPSAPAAATDSKPAPAPTDDKTKPADSKSTPPPASTKPAESKLTPKPADSKLTPRPSDSKLLPRKPDSKAAVKPTETKP